MEHRGERGRDIIAEFERKAGPVIACVRDEKERSSTSTIVSRYDYRVNIPSVVNGCHHFDENFMSALVQSLNALQLGFPLLSDFKFFGWKWTEGGLDDEKQTSSYRTRSVSPS
eukprot:85533-Pelagomonas_calceolata.AAC.1